MSLAHLPEQRSCEYLFVGGSKDGQVLQVLGSPLRYTLPLPMVVTRSSANPELIHDTETYLLRELQVAKYFQHQPIDAVFTVHSPLPPTQLYTVKYYLHSSLLNCKGIGVLLDQILSKFCN